MMFQFASGFNLRDLFQFLKDFGVYEYILPFVLVTTIIFAVLEKTEIFGKGKTNVNIVISFVVGLLLVAQQSIVETINLFLPRVSLIIVVILMGLVVVTMFVGDAFKGWTGGISTLAILIAIVAVVLALSPNFNFGYNYDLSWITPQDRARLLVVGVLVIIFGLLFRALKGNSGSNKSNWLSDAINGMQKGIRGQQ